MVDEEWQREQNFLVLCSQYLPQLNHAGRRFNTFELYDKHADEDPAFTNDWCYHNCIFDQQQPMKLSLVHVLVSGDVQRLENIELPELQCLSLLEPVGDLNPYICERFPTIGALCLYYADPKIAHTFLSSLGQRLHTLVLDGGTLTLAQVFIPCPNLERLNLSSITIDVLITWPKKFFSCLEEVILDYGLHSAGSLIMQVHPTPICIDKLK